MAQETQFLTVKGMKAKRPEWARMTFEIFFWVTSSITIILNGISFIDPTTKATLNEIVLVSIPIAKALSHTLGVVTK